MRWVAGKRYACHLRDSGERVVGWVYLDLRWEVVGVTSMHGQAATVPDAKTAVEAAYWAGLAEGLVGR